MYSNGSKQSNSPHNRKIFDSFGGTTANSNSASHANRPNGEFIDA